MPKGMVITVGVGRGIEHAIALSIRNSNPDHIVFLVTEQSEKTLEKIEQEAKGLGILYRLTKLNLLATKTMPNWLARLPSMPYAS